MRGQGEIDREGGNPDGGSMRATRQWIFLMGIVIGGGSASAAEPTEPWRDLFNGSDLSGWTGDPTYWRVEAGVLVGEVTPDTILERNSWLVYGGEEFADFELKVEFRVSAEGNSGVGYRLMMLEDHPFSVRGPQADIDGAGQWMGNCYEENGRRFLALRGTATEIAPGAMPTLMDRWATEEEMLDGVDLTDWNTMRVVARGNVLRQELNGDVMCEVSDHDGRYGMRSGLIGVQVHIGPPMKIEYRAIRVRRLAPDPDAVWQDHPDTGEALPLADFNNRVTLEHLREAEPEN